MPYTYRSRAPNHTSTTSVTDIPYITLPQADHRKRVLARHRLPDILFEARDYSNSNINADIDVPEGAGIALLDLPGGWSGDEDIDMEALFRMKDPDEVVVKTSTSGKGRVMDLWLMWPDYNNRRGINWPVTGRCHPGGITRKEVATGIRELMMHFFDRFENKASPPDAFRYPIGNAEGQISRHDITIVKAYHLGGSEWQIEIRLPGWAHVKVEEQDGDGDGEMGEMVLVKEDFHPQDLPMSSVEFILPQLCQFDYVPAHMRRADIVFETIYDPHGSNRGIPLNQLPKSLHDYEKIQRIRNPDDVVYFTGPSTENLVIDLWLNWPGYSDYRHGESWPVNRTCNPAGITKKEFLIEINEFVKVTMAKFEKKTRKGEADGFTFPVGQWNGEIWKNHVVVNKVYHMQGQEWQIELSLRGWPNYIKREEEEDVKMWAGYKPYMHTIPGVGHRVNGKFRFLRMHIAIEVRRALNEFLSYHQRASNGAIQYLVNNGVQVEKFRVDNEEKKMLIRPEGIIIAGLVHTAKKYWQIEIHIPETLVDTLKMTLSLKRALKAIGSILAIGLSLQLELRGVAAAPCPNVVVRTVQAGFGTDITARQENGVLNLEARQEFPAELAVTAPDGIVRPYEG
ncbi:hypothetical protein CVT24_005443 [Panaeolus cyanescens]|uniref:Uncharacterized protein n=1 Tax=Panaeolus cyanescens TaxID=181874 RepID=A0A409YC77_9AGAR|nr:hypothetical protein CVT24_005443 [Panaeolus cyanescens]